jgi:Na+/H+ antiporter NhaD/arsenite permease-like protein
MTFATFDWRIPATLVVFVATYAGIVLGRIPGLRIDRAGIALVGASLMVAIGTMDLDEAFRAIDLDLITLLLGMMIIVAQLRVSGFFEIATRFTILRASGPLVLLGAIGALTGLFSAFLVNDAICLVVTPVVTDVCRTLRRNPVPYVLMVAMAANSGSVATITGNPQNMIAGVASGITYVEFAARMVPVAAVSIFSAFILVALFYRKEMSARSFSKKSRRGRITTPANSARGSSSLAVSSLPFSSACRSRKPPLSAVPSFSFRVR